MASTRQRDPERERFWRQTIKAWGRSGGTVRRFCADRGLSEPSFYAWRRQLRERDAAGGTATPERVARRTKRRVAPRFIPIAVKPLTGVAWIEVERGGMTIRLPRDVDLELLAGVVAAIGRVAC